MRDHLNGMLKRSDIAPFDARAIRDVLRLVTELEERVSYAELEVDKAHEARDAAREKNKTAGKRVAELIAECKRLASRAESELPCSGCGRPCYESDLAGDGYLCSRCCPSPADDILKSMSEIMDTGEEIRPFTELHYRANKHLNPSHQFITTMNSPRNTCDICGAVQEAH